MSTASQGLVVCSIGAVGAYVAEMNSSHSRSNFVCAEIVALEFGRTLPECVPLASSHHNGDGGHKFVLLLVNLRYIFNGFYVDLNLHKSMCFLYYIFSYSKLDLTVFT